MKQYQVGIIGFGFIGKVHAYGYLNWPLFYDRSDFSTRITHVCTSCEATAVKGAAQIGAAHAVTDFRSITENPEIDIVHICTPNHLHCDALLSAMRAQKHIYCDKPLTATLEEALRVKAALDRYHGVSQMTLQNRFFPVTMRAKQLIEEGKIGEILEFRASYLHSGNADPETPLKWKLSGAAGGGVAADLGTHILDLMQHLTGDFTALNAATHIAWPDRPAVGDPTRRVKVDAEDNMFVTIRLANGAIGQICASKIATGTEDEISFEIYGDKGAIRLLPMDLHRLYYYDASAAAGPLGGVRGWTAINCGQRFEAPGGFPTPKAPMGWLRGHLHSLYCFLDSVHANTAKGPTLARGVYLQTLLEAIKKSAAGQGWVELS